MKLILALTLVTTLHFTASAQNTPTSVTDYLSVPGPIRIDNQSYHLAWSSHPSENYYKQEYLSVGDSLEKFKTLILAEVLKGNISVQQAAAIEIQKLEKLKQSNPVVHYEQFNKGDETMIDFLLSQNTPDGKYLSFVERNVYRYKVVKDKSGQSILVLFGISVRAYGNDIDQFFANLKAHRSDLLQTIGTFQVPDIRITQ